ncbi:hypothetical protein C4559_01390 [Candidatus Microgenomates bacterium]|nr:MAG: hypothetical protein C4559_01390 [Candidatus Microgenomates bacterium]
MKILSLSLPEYGNVNVPKGVPIGGIGKLVEIFNLALTILIIVAIVLSLFFIIQSGIQWITSGGNKEGLQKARSKLIYSIIGLIVVILAVFIVNIVGGFLNIDLLNFRLP